MSFLPSDPRRLWGAAAAASGVGAFVFPLFAPWHLIFLIIATIAGLGLLRETH